MWRREPRNATIREVTAEIPEYPNKDSDDETIYLNTHFLTPEAAWKSCLDELDAGVRNEVSVVESLRRRLAEAEAKLVNRVLLHERARQNHQTFRFETEE